MNCVSGFDSNEAARQAWSALVDANVFTEGNFVFASGTKATLKVDADKLYSHPEQLEVLLDLYAAFPCVAAADVLLYVPDGWRQFTVMLASRLSKPVVHTDKIPGAARYSYQFRSDADRHMAHSAKRPVICEDVVTTLGSVAGVRGLLLPEQEVHSLAVLLRGEADPVYQKGLVDHYLVRRKVPLDKSQFNTEFLVQ